MIPRSEYKTWDEINYNVSLGRQIRKIRKDKNFRLQDVSTLTGFNERQLIKYEYGDSGLTCYRLNKICIALGVNTSEVINNASNYE